MSYSSVSPYGYPLVRTIEDVQTAEKQHFAVGRARLEAAHQGIEYGTEEYRTFIRNKLLDRGVPVPPVYEDPFKKAEAKPPDPVQTYGDLIAAATLDYTKELSKLKAKPKAERKPRVKKVKAPDVLFSPFDRGLEDRE